MNILINFTNEPKTIPYNTDNQLVIDIPSTSNDTVNYGVALNIIARNLLFLADNNDLDAARIYEEWQTSKEQDKELTLDVEHPIYPYCKASEEIERIFMRTIKELPIDYELQVLQSNNFINEEED